MNELVTIKWPLTEKNFVKVHALEGASMLGIILAKPLRLYGAQGIGLGFALDQHQYAADLRKHGVHVRPGDYRQGVFELF